MQRCKAKSKRSGIQCKNYAIKAYSVCRMHGAYGGPKTKQGLAKCSISSIKHGLYSRKMKAKMDTLRNLIKNSSL